MSFLDDNDLKQTLETRKQHADDRINQLRKANSFLEDDDDGILEKIFNNLTGNIHDGLQNSSTTILLH